MESTSVLPATARKLEGKVALITGGASGIGEYTARLFCQHGAKVVIADIQDDLGNSVCHQLGPDAASYIYCDVTDESNVSNAVDHAVEKFGKLDIMFNNAGIGGKPIHSILKSEKSDFERMLAVNVVGPFLGTKHAARVMVPARGGCIIATASIAGVVSGGASYAYTCAKIAVVGLTKNAAVELGRHGIRVNCVSPAALAMECVGLGGEEVEAALEATANLKGVRLKVEDVGKAVLYLASEEGLVCEWA